MSLKDIIRLQELADQVYRVCVVLNQLFLAIFVVAVCAGVLLIAKRRQFKGLPCQVKLALIGYVLLAISTITYRALVRTHDGGAKAT